MVPKKSAITGVLLVLCAFSGFRESTAQQAVSGSVTPSTAPPGSTKLSTKDFTFDLQGSSGESAVSNSYGKLQQLTSAQEPALGGNGFAQALITIEPCSFLTPHTHPRATEVYYVISGTISAGVVLESPDGRLINATVPVGNTVVFPQGNLHFAQNLGYTPAVIIAALNNENPGIQLYPTAFQTLPMPLQIGTGAGSPIGGAPIIFGPLPPGTCGCAPMPSG